MNALRLRTAFEQGLDTKLDKFLKSLLDGVMTTQMTMIRDDGTEEDWGYTMISESGGVFFARNKTRFQYMNKGTAESSKEIPKTFMDFVLHLREAISIWSTQGREADVAFCKTWLKVLERQGAQDAEDHRRELERKKFFHEIVISEEKAT